MADLIDRIVVSAYVIPTASHESDGTFEWDQTTMVLVELSCAGLVGLGYTYADRATAIFAEEHLGHLAIGSDPMEPARLWAAMRHDIRNLGRPGVASMAMAAVDTAAWDLKAQLLGLPLVQLLGKRREKIPLYASGGFTSYADRELAEQLGGWSSQGFRMVKMKVGRDPKADVRRVRLARRAIGPGVELFVDANGAHDPSEAIAQAARFAPARVTYFEEPVSSDDLAGLALVRQHLSGRMSVAAGEYGYDLPYFERMLDARAVDILQADVTRCAGITELMRVAALCEARDIPLSLHTAPALHLHPACANDAIVHLEYFHDHVRIEGMLFDGIPDPVGGALSPDESRAGNGLVLRRDAAAPYLTYRSH